MRTLQVISRRITRSRRRLVKTIRQSHADAVYLNVRPLSGIQNPVSNDRVVGGTGLSVVSKDPNRFDCRSQREMEGNATGGGDCA